MAANQIGFVSASKGEVFARNADGQMRRLRVGDPVFEKEVIVTANGSSVEITPLNGPALNIAEQQTLVLDDQVFSSAPDAASGGVSPLSSTLAAQVIQTAGNQDFNQQLDEEAAAAGLTGGGDGAGHSFVDLLRIIEAINPVGFAFPANAFPDPLRVAGDSPTDNDVTLVASLTTEEESVPWMLHQLVSMIFGGRPDFQLPGLNAESIPPNSFGNNEAEGNFFMRSGNVAWPPGTTGTINSVGVDGQTFGFSDGRALIFFDADGNVHPQSWLGGFRSQETSEFPGSNVPAAVLVVNSDGLYRFIVLGEFNHQAQFEENDFVLPPVVFNATGSNGGNVTVNLTLNVIDDVPEYVPEGYKSELPIFDSPPSGDGESAREVKILKDRFPGSTSVVYDEDDTPHLTLKLEEESVPGIGGNNEMPDSQKSDPFANYSYTVSSPMLGIPFAQPFHGLVNWGADGFGSVTSFMVGDTVIAVPADAEISIIPTGSGISPTGPFLLDIGPLPFPGGVTVFFDADGALLVEEDGTPQQRTEGDPPEGSAVSLTLMSDGHYTVTVLGALDHDPVAGENWLKLPAIAITGVDGDGDPIVIPLDISIQDDIPTVSGNALVQLDDDELPGGIPGGSGDDSPTPNLTGTLSHSFGADGGSISWLTPTWPEGQNFSSDITENNSLLIKQGGVTVLTVTLNQETGAYTVTQNKAIHHPDNPDELSSYENNVAFTLNYRVTDGDDDYVDGTLAINVDDDSPSIVVSSMGKMEEDVLKVDDLYLTLRQDAIDTADYSDNFADNFTTNGGYGADGPGRFTTAYSLWAEDGSDSGLHAWNESSILLYLNDDGEVEGRTSGTGDDGDDGQESQLIFKVSVDPVTGVVTLQQFAEIIGTDETPDGLSMADALVRITRTATVLDSDGDSASDSESINIGEQLVFISTDPESSVQPDTVLTNIADGDAIETIVIPQWALLHNDSDVVSAITGVSVVDESLVDVSIAGSNILAEDGFGGGEFRYEADTGGSASVTIDREQEGSSQLTGTANAEILIGSDEGSTISGLGGDDILIGGVGDDVLRGGVGDDVLDGVTGADTFAWSLADVPEGTAVTDIVKGFGTDDILQINDLLDGGGSVTVTAGASTEVHIINDTHDQTIVLENYATDATAAAAIKTALEGTGHSFTG